MVADSRAEASPVLLRTCKDKICSCSGNRIPLWNETEVQLSNVIASD